MTFTERNFPPPEAAGEVIPDGVRVSLLNWFAQEGITSGQKLWPTFCQQEGYGTFDEITDDISRQTRTGSQSAPVDDDVDVGRHYALAYAGFDVDTLVRITDT